MKKLIFAIITMLGFTCGAKADGPADPSQILASLLQHVTPVSEFTSHGQTKLEFLDGIIQVGHYQGDYVLAVDGGVANSLEPDQAGHLAGTAGVHVHIISFVNSFFKINPALAQTLSLIEATPRYSYDWDVHHAVLGFTFGARIPFQ